MNKLISDCGDGLLSVHETVWGGCHQFTLNPDQRRIEWVGNHHASAASARACAVALLILADKLEKLNGQS